ncbi:hypothetical protein Tco_0493155 [Tanacetum coccineum]
MSKKNLSTVTCSLAQDDLVDFVEEYGISLGYDPKLPKPGQKTLDAPDGYIPMYLALFTIGNLRFPLNSFCLDAFEFFIATMPLFRAFLTLGSVGDWLTFQKRHGPDIPTLFDESLYDAWTRFKNLIQRVPHHGLDLWSLAQFFCDHVDRYTQIDIDHPAGRNLRVLSAEEAWETIEDCAQYDKQWKNPTSTIPDQTIANLKTNV